ncbi:MAG TPA: PAS domain-containing protein [Nitratidesulfovibrio sp.]|nr:PAS domain-containing protein [Nitratidesulfovibrio sp.]
MTCTDLVAFYAARLDVMDTPALLLDGGGGVLYANKPARLLRGAGEDGEGATETREAHDNLSAPGGPTPAHGWLHDEVPPVPEGGAPVRESRTRITLPDGAGIRQISWTCVAVPVPGLDGAGDTGKGERTHRDGGRRARPGDAARQAGDGGEVRHAGMCVMRGVVGAPDTCGAVGTEGTEGADGTDDRNSGSHASRVIPPHRPTRSVYLAWGRLRTTEGGQEMGFTILPSGVIQAVSPALCAICGYTRDELVGRSAREFYFTSTARKRIVSQLIRRAEVENGEVTLRRKDGSPLTLWYTAESIRDAAGRMVAYSGYFQERPFAFSSKLASDFSRVVDALPGLAWVCGRDLRIVAVNDAYLTAYRRTRDEVMGRTEYDFLPPELARYPVEAALKVFEEKRELEHPAVPHLLEPSVWYRVIRRPIFDDNRQEVIGLLGIAQDISAKVVQENAFIEQLHTHQGDVVVVTDDQGRILRRSRQTLTPAIFGRQEPYDAYTLDMGPVLDLLHEGDLPAVRQALLRAMREQREQHFECRIRNLSGSYSTVHSRLVYNDTIYGEPRVYVVARDVSGEVGLRQAPMVLERLKEAAGARTDRELAGFLNVSAASISNARKNGRIPPDWLIDAGLRTGRSIDWLVRGVA